MERQFGNSIQISSSCASGYQRRHTEKLNYLTARLGDEIASMKGKRGGFAPHAERPDSIVHKLRIDLPVWVLCSVFALISILGYIGLRTMLDKDTEVKMAKYDNIIELAPKSANLTIILP